MFKEIIVEYSKSMIKDLLVKFGEQTTDSQEEILSTINDFEKYRGAYPVEYRNIQNISYSKMKSLNLGYKKNKAFDELVKYYLKTDTGIDLAGLKNDVKKFLFLMEFLSEKDKDYRKYTAKSLGSFIAKTFDNVMSKSILDHFKNEAQLDTLSFYINRFLEVINRVPTNTPPIKSMSFVDFEHVVDSLGNIEAGTRSKLDSEDIPILYLENGLTIFAPKTKDQCVKLRNGRSWCISREGSGNLYYNYRIGHGRTIYFVINENLPPSDLNYACVILVSKYGGKALADGSNSGKYSGHSDVSWQDIVSKIPQIQNLEHLFVPSPMSSEEEELINKVKDARPGNDLIKHFGDEKTTEMWLEYNSPKLNDEQYSSLTPELKKKYIALGFDLTYGMLQSSEPQVLKYYVSKHSERIANKNLAGLTDNEMAFLNLKIMTNLRESLKVKFTKELIVPKSNSLIIEGFTSGVMGKYLSLYGLDDLFDNLPNNLKTIRISDSNPNLGLEIGASFTKFTELEFLVLDGCAGTVTSDICKLTNLTSVTLIESPALTTIPECIADLPNIMILNVTGSDNVVIPQKILDKTNTMGDDSVYFFESLNDFI